MKALFKVIGVATVGASLALAFAVSRSAPGSAKTLAEASRSAPAHTAEKFLSLQKAHRSTEHPLWRTLTAQQRVDRIAMFVSRKLQALAAGVPSPDTLAAFQGSLTQVKTVSGQGIYLERQSDCSFTYNTGTYAIRMDPPEVHVLSSTPNIQDVLHSAAGLNTTADLFPGGCADTLKGLGTRRAFYLGKTDQPRYLFASTGYDYSADSDAVFLVTADPSTRTLGRYQIDHTVRNIAGMTAGDLNKDGIADLAVLDLQAGTATVFMSQIDGTLGGPVVYPAAGSRGRAAVMADLDGDGKLDLVVAGSALDTTTGREEQTVAVLRGRGTGALEPATTFSVPTPAGGNGLLTSLIAVDLRGTGKPDIVGSNGLVLLNNGSGVLSPAPAFGFPAPGAGNIYGPNLAAGDFNEDGKPDIVVDNGSTVQIWLGRGDGTFSLGRAYANNDSVGYVNVVDIDGDGHLDLWIGLGNSGLYGADQYGVNQGYALMGRGDGSFSGAPVQPFVYTGNNLVDLDKDGKLDGVGVNADHSFTSYRGDGAGVFTAASTLSFASLTFGTETFTPGDVESFALGDVDGDGNVDLVFLSTGFFARNSTADFNSPGFLVAKGNGSGGFATPTFVPAPAFVAAPDFDNNLQLTNVRLADVNGDGKADLVYAYATSSYSTRQRTLGTAVQLGNGNGTFQAPKTITFYSAPDTGSFPFISSQVQHIVDLNGDGKPDLVLASQTLTIDSTLSGYRTNIQVAKGRGDGTFDAPVNVDTADIFVRHSGEGLSPVVVADVNGDGVPDIALLGSSTTYSLQVALALGNGDGTFKPPSRTTFAAQALGNGQNLAVADFNGDGKADVLIANPYGRTGIALGNGDGTLSPVGSAGSYIPNLSIILPLIGTTRVVDFNGDGKPDVIVGNVQLLSAAEAASPTPTFSLGADSLAGSVHAGQSVQSNVSVTPATGFSGTVAFSCTGLPAGAACGFSPASVSVSGGTPASTTLTLTTTAAAGFGAAARGDGGSLGGSGGSGAGAKAAMLIAAVASLVAFVAFASLAGSLAGGRGSPQPSSWPAWRRRLGLGALLATGGLVLASCGGHDHVDGSGPPSGGGTPAGSYSVTVTGSDGTVSKSVAYTLVVN